MKLLVLTPNFPAPSWGAGTRNYHFLKALAKRHTVTLLCLVDGEKSALPNASLLQDVVYKISYIVRSTSVNKRLLQVASIARLKPYFLASNYFPEMQDALDGMLAEDQYDAVLFESALIACYRLRAGVKCLIDQHNIEYDLLRRTFQEESHL